MSGIDWSKAPEGTTGAMVANFIGATVTHGTVEFLGHPNAVGRHVYTEGADSWVYHERPAPAWAGGGRPPVGTICNAWYDDGRECWHAAEVICVHPTDPYLVAVRLMSERQHNRLAWVDNLRPQLTPEQIAAEEQAQALREIEQLYAEGGPAALYDAGYRKQVQP